MSRLETLWAQATSIWAAGGPAMWGIAAIALVLFATGVRVHLELRDKGFRAAPEHVWRRWIVHRIERRGRIGELLDFVLDGASRGRSSRHGGSYGGALRSDQDIATAFAQLRPNEIGPFARDLRVMKVCVSAAPLVGLLGTVTGMLATFGALAAGSGGDKTMGMIASGISEALITTETGLVVALPGLFFQYQLTRRYEQYQAFLAHLETVCTQAMHRRVRQQQELRLRRVAAGRVARKVCERLDQLERLQRLGRAPQRERAVS